MEAAGRHGRDAPRDDRSPAVRVLRCASVLLLDAPPDRSGRMPSCDRSLGSRPGRRHSEHASVLFSEDVERAAAFYSSLGSPRASASGRGSRRPSDPDRPAPAIPCVTVVTRRLVSLARGFGFRHLGDEPGAKVTYVLEHRSHRPVVGVGHVAREHGVARSDDLVEPEQPVRVDGLRPLRAYSSASATSAAARSFSTTVYPSRSATTRSTSGYT